MVQKCIQNLSGKKLWLIEYQLEFKPYSPNLVNFLLYTTYYLSLVGDHLSNVVELKWNDP